MRYNEFKSWMENNTSLQPRPIADALSRVRRIENSLHLDMDLEYIKDGGNYVLNKLEYTATDESNCKQAPIGLTFKSGANIRNGMASLKAAAKQYFSFCQATLHQR